MPGFLPRGPLFNVIGGATLVTAAAGGAAYTALGQSRARPPVPVARKAQSDAFLVCVGKDRVLRSADAGCRPEEQQIKIDRAETKVAQCDDCDAWGAPPKGSRAGADGGADDRIGQLERRLDAALERYPWFKVVDKTGRVLFDVTRDRVAVYDRDGLAVATLNANGDGGVLTAGSSDRVRRVSVGVTGEQAGLAVSDGGSLRVDLGRQAAGNYALRILSAGAALAAGIGESRAGSGTMVVGDEGGRIRASASAADGVGALELNRDDGETLVSMRESQSGAGLLSLGKKDGREAVKMDVNDGRYGAVLAGPTIGAPLMTGSGLPGSYILGCAGGDSCRPY